MRLHLGVMDLLRVHPSIRKPKSCDDCTSLAGSGMCGPWPVRSFLTCVNKNVIVLNCCNCLDGGNSVLLLMLNLLFLVLYSFLPLR